MRNIFYILHKYWCKHKGSAMSLMFVGVLMVIIVLVTFLQYRATFNRELHKLYDISGMYDIQLPAVPEQIVMEITNEKTDVTRSEIYVCGKLGTAMIQYTYGYIDDSANLMHIPMESGRMPEQADEIAIDRSVLTRFHWSGTVGESIVLNDTTYKVVGIIDEIYSEQRLSSELGFMAMEGDCAPYPIPLIYIGKASGIDEIEYQITLLDGVIESESDVEKYDSLLYENLGENVRWCELQQKNLLAEDISKKDSFRFDTRWMLILASIAAVIAMLSVYSVLQNIFEERHHYICLLHRIGMSANQICVMYFIECVCFIIVQSIIGIVFGLIGYGTIYQYQTNMLDMSAYSAFTADVLVTQRTGNAFVISVLFSAFVTGASYLIMVAFGSHRNAKKIIKNKLGTLNSNLSALFCQRTITIIQTISLSLIVFGTMLGYMYYTDNGKEQLDGLKFDFPETYEVGNGFDMEEDCIEEYYSCQEPSVNAIQSFENDDAALFMADNQFDIGLTDTIVSEFENVTACGELKQTFIISENENETYNEKIEFKAQEQKDFIVQFSDKKYKTFFDAGQLGTKYLYRMNTKLASGDVIEKLAPYVSQGSIDIRKLNAGTHVVIVVKADSGKYNVGDIISVGSVMANGNYGIGDIAECSVEISAVVVVPNDCDKLLKYAVLDHNYSNILTTALGAENMGLHNAIYNELFSAEDIDGGLIPAEAGMNLTSYTEIKRRERIDVAMKYGGMALLVILMSLLGFSAYFNGIGLKIKAKQYNIAVLRAIGTPVSCIRRKMIVDNLKLPLIASVIAGIGIAVVQTITESAYKQLILLNSPEFSGGEDNYQKIIKLIDTYFLENQLWVVPIVKPLIILAAVMCLVTVILTLLSLGKLNANIADTLNIGRERK